MVQQGAALGGNLTAPWPSGLRDTASDARFRAMREQHFELVWRSARRLGVPEADTDDAVQQVFIIAASKLQEIEIGRERSFLFGVVMRVASHVRRSERRRAEVGDDDLDDRVDEAPLADDLVERRRARALLDEVLEAMPMEARAVFVLFELEEMTLTEIAEMLAIPRGTAASRLRRARELFQEEMARVGSRCDR